MLCDDGNSSSEGFTCSMMRSRPDVAAACLDYIMIPPLRLLQPCCSPAAALSPLCIHLARESTPDSALQVYESCMALGMLPMMEPCTPRNASREFAVVGDAATAVAAIRCQF